MIVFSTGVWKSLQDTTGCRMRWMTSTSFIEGPLHLLMQNIMTWNVQFKIIYLNKIIWICIKDKSGEGSRTLELMRRLRFELACTSEQFLSSSSSNKNVKRILCLKVVYVQGWDTPRLWRWLRNGPSWILPCPLKPLHNFKIHYFSIDQIKLATLLVFRRTFLKPIFLSSIDCQMYLNKMFMK